MYNAAIIGAGQLGSRHLQGLKTASLPMKIWVIDNSEESLIIAKQRYDQVPVIGEKELFLKREVSELPKSLDFVVVATGSKPRAALIKSLLHNSNVKYMVLEKVLFPKLQEYDEIEELINRNNVKCWVNCGRRLLSYPYDIKKVLNDGKIEMLYEGTDWGLCCNSIHIIDLFMLFVNEKDYIVDTTGLYNEISESKRKGYIELYGNLQIITPHGNRLTLRCEKPENIINPLMEIKDGSNSIIVDERNKIYEYNNSVFSYQMPFQSEMTGLYADLIIKTGNCQLSSLGDSVKYHKPFIRAILDFYNNISNNNSDICPIT